MSKKQYKADYKPCMMLSSSDKHFAMVYEQMFKSEAFRKLPIGAREFYIACRIQANTTDGRACLMRHGNEYGISYNIETEFVFPEKHLESFGYKRGNAYKLFRQLEQAGFITINERNKPLKRVNVYAFSDKWKS